MSKTDYFLFLWIFVNATAVIFVTLTHLAVDPVQPDLVFTAIIGVIPLAYVSVALVTGECTQRYSRSQEPISFYLLVFLLLGLSTFVTTLVLKMSSLPFPMETVTRVEGK